MLPTTRSAIASAAVPDRCPDDPDIGRGRSPARQIPADQPVRHRRPLGGQARHLLERVQGPPDRNLPRRRRRAPRARSRPGTIKTGSRPPRPNLITNVATTDASVADAAMTADHEQLAARGLAPARALRRLRLPQRPTGRRRRPPARHHVDLPDAGRRLPPGQGRGRGFHAGAFSIDWDHQQVTCPQGHRSSSWIPATQRGHDSIVVRFDTATCRACPSGSRAPPPSAADER